MHTSLLKKAAVNAIGVLAYVSALVWFWGHAEQILGMETGGMDMWIGPVLMLIVFVVSACVTGTLVLGLPIMMYLDGQRRQAVTLLVYTVASLVGIVVLLGVIIALWK